MIDKTNIYTILYKKIAKLFGVKRRKELNDNDIKTECQIVVGNKKADLYIKDVPIYFGDCNLEGHIKFLNEEVKKGKGRYVTTYNASKVNSANSSLS